MTDFTLKQQSFVQNDIPTPLGHLAANLSQIQTFWLEGSHQDTLIQLFHRELLVVFGVLVVNF
jgi:hypothetical protein